jgi:hypothetical protein
MRRVEGGRRLQGSWGVWLWAWLTMLGVGGHAESVGAQTASRADEGALFLLLPVGAQGVSVGRAMTAVSSAESVFWNPAGLAGITERRVVFHRGDHVIGDGTSISVLFPREGIGLLAVSYQLFDVGAQDLTDGMGNVLGSLSIRNHQAVLSGAIRLGDRVGVGLNVKNVRFEVGCRGQCPEGRVVGTSNAVDLGVQAAPFQRLPIRFGAMVAHLGPRFQVENSEQADPLPLRMRGAIAADLFRREIEGEAIGFTALVEVEDRVRNPGNPAILLGGEFFAGSSDRIVARGGYILAGSGPADHLEAAAVGLGIRYERLELDVARSLARRGLASQQEPIHFTVGVRF